MAFYPVLNCTLPFPMWQQWWFPLRRAYTLADGTVRAEEDQRDGSWKLLGEFPSMAACTEAVDFDPAPERPYIRAPAKPLARGDETESMASRDHPCGDANALPSGAAASHGETA